MKRALFLALALLAAACGPKIVPEPPAVAVPKYPDFLFPSVPLNVGTPAAVDRHTAAFAEAVEALANSS